MAKKEKDVVKFLVQYMGLKDLLKRTNIQKILAGDASFTGTMAESDLDALKAARRYVDFISQNLKIGDETIDRYFSRLQGVYTGADTSKRVGIYDADYPSYVAAVLATDKADGKKRISDAIIDNEEVEKAIAGLPLALGKEKGLSYVAAMTQYLALAASISGLNGNITELIRSNETERAKSKRVSELLAERTKRLQDLEKVDAGFVALMAETKKTASQDSVDAGFAAIASQIATLREDIVKSVQPTFDPAVLEGVKKSVVTSQQTVLKRLGTIEGKIVGGFQDILNQMYDSESRITEFVRVETDRSISHVTAETDRVLAGLTADGGVTRAHVTSEADRVIAGVTADGGATRTHVTAEADRGIAHVTAEADRVIEEVKRHSTVKSGVWGKVITGGVALILIASAFFAGRAVPYKDTGSTSEPTTKVEYVDEGYKEKYNEYFESVGVDFAHYRSFVSEVEEAAADRVISKDEYAALSTKAAEPASTEDFPRTEMETAVLNNAIYSTEIAQYDDVKGMIDTRFADKDFTIAEQAEVQTVIDGYRAEDLEGKFSSTPFMTATFDSAKEYSELNVLYNNLLNSQPGTTTPAPSYAADMKDAMTTLQVALSDQSLTQEEIATLDAIIERLEATGDDNAEIFAEKLDAVIDSFVAQIDANAQLASDKAAAEQGKADAEAERDQWKQKYEEAQDKADELEDSVQKLTDKVSELETKLQTDAAAAAKAYEELEKLYNKALSDYQELYAKYQELVTENAQIPELEKALVDAGNQIAALTEQIAQSKDIILDYYYQYTGTQGTLEEALAFFAQVNGSQGNQQGTPNADPEAPSYGK